LFWALRGAGGGQFGVVTSLVFDPVPAPQATRFELTWPLPQAAAVIAAWQQWAPDAPDGMSAALKISAGAHSDLESGPGQVIVFGAMLGTEADTAAMLGELTRLADTGPVSQQLASLPYRDLKRSLTEIGSADPAQPVISKSEFFRAPLPARSIAELLDAFGQDRPPGQHREVNFTPMGGAYNRVPPEATAFVHRSERFLLDHAAAGPDAARWVQRSWATVHPCGSGRVYPNFPDPDLANWAEAYHGANHARLAELKRGYDPQRLLHFPQSL
jgi:FAD/FMN-containing dehydrogenase